MMALRLQLREHIRTAVEHTLREAEITAANADNEDIHQLLAALRQDFFTIDRLTAEVMLTIPTAAD